MKPAVSIVLIIMGALVMLGPIASHTYSGEADKKRADSYRTFNPSLKDKSGVVLLPADVDPGYKGYEFACFLAAAAMIAIGGIGPMLKPPAN